MTEASETFLPPTSEASRNVISSPASADGLPLFASRDGATSATSGPDRAHVSHSPQSASGKASPTNGTSGLFGTNSSGSDDLQSSLENNLRKRLTGSDLCEVTWKPWTTPWGQSRAADVSLIAASYGGGGHKNAAGFQVPVGWEGDLSATPNAG